MTSDEGDVGSAHCANFQDVETQTPVILTTSQLLTTGVDAPTCKNVVLARVVGSIRTSNAQDVEALIPAMLHEIFNGRAKIA